MLWNLTKYSTFLIREHVVCIYKSEQNLSGDVFDFLYSYNFRIVS